MTKGSILPRNFSFVRVTGTKSQSPVIGSDIQSQLPLRPTKGVLELLFRSALSEALYGALSNRDTPAACSISFYPQIINPPLLNHKSDYHLSFPLPLLSHPSVFCLLWECTTTPSSLPSTICSMTTALLTPRQASIVGAGTKSPTQKQTHCADTRNTYPIPPLSCRVHVHQTPCQNPPTGEPFPLGY